MGPPAREGGSVSRLDYLRFTVIDILQKGSQQLNKSRSCFEINFWDCSFRAQFEPTPSASAGGGTRLFRGGALEWCGLF